MLLRRRFSTLPVTELVERDRHRVLDRRGALGEHRQQILRHAGDLGLALHDRPPLDAEPVGELVAQHRLVQAAEHPLMPLQIAGIERQPPALDGLHLRRDHGVGVDLRVIGPRRRLAEHRHRQALRVRMQPAAVMSDPRRRPEPLQMRQRRGDGDIVSLQEPVVARQRPPHRHRLRRRERRIKPRHRLDHPPIGE